jgi:curli production assembly/transport component CsgF
MTVRCLLLLTLATLPAHATELVYVPVNPAFGGNALNGNALLNNAQAQDDNRDPASEDLGPGEKSSLDSFNEMLQRAVLSRLASSVTSSIIGPDGELVPGTVETNDFVITVIDVGGGMLEITTTDRATGDTTVFQVASGL